MTHRLLVVPTARRVGVTSVCLGIVRALERLGLRFAFYNPVARALPDRSTELVRLTTSLDPPEPIAGDEVERLLGLGEEAELLERIVAEVERLSVDRDVVVVEGLMPVENVVYAQALNVAIAKALDAELVLVSAQSANDPVKLADNIDIASRAYGDIARGPSRCCILNRVASEAPGELDALRAEIAELNREIQSRMEGVAPVNPPTCASSVKSSSATGAGSGRRWRENMISYCAPFARVTTLGS